MQLILIVENSAYSEQLGSTYRFGTKGGTIGRSASNDWTLMDPERFVSECHARIAFKEGRFILTDTSTNGTYINGKRQRIPRHESVFLNTGDQLLIGNMRLSVVVVDERRNTVEHTPAYDWPALERESAAQLKNPVPAVSSEPVALFPKKRHELPTSRPRPEPAPGGPPQNEKAGGFTCIHPKAPAKMPNPAPSDTALAALIEGLGIGPLSSATDPINFSRECGRALRLLAEGTMQALQTRSQTQEHMNLKRTSRRTGGNNPLKFSESPELALERMFNAPEDGTYIRGIPALQEALEDLRIHDIAILAAIHATVEALIKGFNPQLLEKKLREIAPAAAATPVLGDAKRWNLYQKYFREIAAKLRDDTRLGFPQEFAKAYEDEEGYKRKKECQESAD